MDGMFNVWVEMGRWFRVQKVLSGGRVNSILCCKGMECLLCGLKWTVGCGYTVYCVEAV